MIRWPLPSAIEKIDPHGGASYIRNMSDVRLCSARMVSCVAHLLTAAALVCGFATAAAAQPADVPAYTVTPGRIMASGAAVTGLIGAIIGGLALVRSADRAGVGNGRRGAIVALVLGPVGVVVGGLVVIRADGGLGTGNGLGGGVVAMIVGLIGMALGGLALARSRRAA